MHVVDGARACHGFASGARAAGVPGRLFCGDHDRAVALTSHAPQVFASVLTVMAHRLNAEAAAGPGYLSATRVAGGNVSMWRDIFSSNADAVSQVILDLAEELKRAGQALQR